MPGDRLWGMGVICSSSEGIPIHGTWDSVRAQVDSTAVWLLLFHSSAHGFRIIPTNSFLELILHAKYVNKIGMTPASQC